MDDDETDPRSARARLMNSLVLGVLQQLSEASQRPAAAARPQAGDVVLGLGAVAVEASRRVTVGVGLVLRPLAAMLAPPSVVTATPTRLLRDLAERGREERADAAEGLQALAQRIAPRVLDRALSLVEVTDLVRDHVDLDTLVADVDVDAVAARIDLDAILNRVDIDQVASRLDVDTVAARIDLDAILNRVDIDQIASRLDVDTVAARIDLDAILNRVDIDQIASRLDVDTVAARIDLDAILNRVDIDQIASRLDVDTSPPASTSTPSSTASTSTRSLPASTWTPWWHGSTWSRWPSSSSRASTCRASSRARPGRWPPWRAGRCAGRASAPTSAWSTSSTGCSAVGERRPGIASDEPLPGRSSRHQRLLSRRPQTRTRPSPSPAGRATGWRPDRSPR